MNNTVAATKMGTKAKPALTAALDRFPSKSPYDLTNAVAQASATTTGRSHVLIKAIDPRKRDMAAASTVFSLSQFNPKGSGDTNRFKVRLKANNKKGRLRTCGWRSPNKKLKSGNSVIV